MTLTTVVELVVGGLATGLVVLCCVCRFAAGTCRRHSAWSRRFSCEKRVALHLGKAAIVSVGLRKMSNFGLLIRSGIRLAHFLRISIRKLLIVTSPPIVV